MSTFKFRLQLKDESWIYYLNSVILLLEMPYQGTVKMIIITATDWRGNF